MGKPRPILLFPRCKGMEILYEIKEIVLCEDCKHYDPTTHFCMFYENTCIEPYDFCSEGEEFSAFDGGSQQLPGQMDMGEICDND